MNSGLRQAFRHFTRNERWGTCVECPRDGDGLKVPELCPKTGRYDHQLSAESLFESYRRSTRIEETKNG